MIQLDSFILIQIDTKFRFEISIEMASQRTLIENPNVQIMEGGPPETHYEKGMCGGWSEWGPVTDSTKELTEMVCI